MSLCYVTRSFVIYIVNRILIVTFGESRGSYGLMRSCWENFLKYVQSEEQNVE